MSFCSLQQLFPPFGLASNLCSSSGPSLDFGFLDHLFPWSPDCLPENQLLWNFYQAHFHPKADLSCDYGSRRSFCPNFLYSHHFLFLVQNVFCPFFHLSPSLVSSRHHFHDRRHFPHLVFHHLIQLQVERSSLPAPPLSEDTTLS